MEQEHIMAQHSDETMSGHDVTQVNGAQPRKKNRKSGAAYRRDAAARQAKYRNKEREKGKVQKTVWLTVNISETIKKSVRQGWKHIPVLMVKESYGRIIYPDGAYRDFPLTAINTHPSDWTSH